MKTRKFVAIAALVLAIGLPGALISQPASAQTPGGCIASEIGDPPRTVFQCAGGIVLEAEAATLLGIAATGDDQRPTGAEVTGKAVLIQVTPGSGPFQIRTPHAIAAVRGTEYVVDVTGDKTAVFVREGTVIVSRPDGADPVTLTKGLGADVTPGQPFTAARWPDERVTELMSRFAR